MKTIPGREFEIINLEECSPADRRQFVEKRLSKESIAPAADDIERFITSLPDSTPLSIIMACEILEEVQKPSYENKGSSNCFLTRD